MEPTVDDLQPTHQIAEGIRVRGLRKRFGEVDALAGIDLEASPGEIVSVLGPNGAGKSTLIRIIGSTVLPDSGSVTVGGVSVLAEPATARGLIGLSIGEERSLYWRLDGRQNLLFFATLHGIRGRDAKREVDRLLDEVGLAAAAERPVRTYSSGMRARLALARALLADPPVLLLDEPTRSLDPLAAAEFRERALELADRRGTAILLATHDLHEAVAISTRVLVLSAGRVLLERDGHGLDVPGLERAFLDAIATDARGVDAA